MSSPELKTALMGELWTMAVQLGDFTVAELVSVTGAAKPSAHHLVKQWERDGHLAGDGSERGERFQVVQSNSPLFGSKEKRIWQAIRVCKQFSCRDIAVLATQELDVITPSDVDRYVQMLVGAEILRQTQTAVKGKRPARYLLLRDLGPKPPVAKRVHCVFDPNGGELIANARFREAHS